MGFTRALYYPTIDIEDEEWLKTAVLFWDEINTIVPSSIKYPYQEHSTQYLSDIGILQPIRVNPDHDFIEDLTDDTINYLNTNEGYQLLTQGRGSSFVHQDKMPKNVNKLFNIHHEKLPYFIQNELEKDFNQDGWVQVDSSFAMFYMTLLANKICEQRSIALLSDNFLISNLSDKIRLDNQIAIGDRDSHHRTRANRSHKQEPIYLAQGLLTNLIIKGIRISKTSSLEDIISFKDKYRDELGIFRTNIAKLTQNVSKGAQHEAIRQQINDVYNDEFLPSYNNFKKALSGYGIKWVSDNFMKVSLISTGATALPMALLGLNLPQALLAGAGVSLITSAISYNEDKKEKLRTSPYSYLLSIDQHV